MIALQASMDALPETCTLDVADRGGATLEEVSVCFGVTRERIRTIEAEALRKLEHADIDLDGRL